MGGMRPTARLVRGRTYRIESSSVQPLMDRKETEQQPGAPAAGAESLTSTSPADGLPIRLDGESATSFAEEAVAEGELPPALNPPCRPPTRPWPRRGDRFYGYGGRRRGAW